MLSCMPQSFVSCVNVSEENWVPLSVVIVEGTP